MIRPVNRDPIFLSRVSTPATAADLSVARDLLDTLSAHADECVGMAANMIGVAKNIIVFDNNGTYMTMFNPEIIAKKGEYSAEEGCLSLPSKREAVRYRVVTVKYQDADFHTKTGTFSGWTAQIIQHEIDHCRGKLI